MLDILCVGDTSEDVFLVLAEDDAALLCDVDKQNCRLSLSFSDKIPIKTVVALPGGNSANLAVGLSRLGFKSALLTQLGDDSRGDTLLQALHKDKVKLDYVRRDTRTASNFSTVIVYQTERTILIHHETRQYVWPRAVKPAHWVYFSSLGEGGEVLVPPMLGYLTKNKSRLAFNPGTYQLRWPLTLLRQVLASTSALFINVEEAELIVARTNRAKPGRMSRQIKIDLMLAQLKGLGPEMVVITDGQLGVSAITPDGIIRTPITNRAKRVEATGAGDAMAVGFVAALMTKQSIETALHWGLIESSSVVQFIGPQAGLLTEKVLLSTEKAHLAAGCHHFNTAPASTLPPRRSVKTKRLSRTVRKKTA